MLKKGDRIKDDIKLKLILIEQLNSNLDSLFENPEVDENNIEQNIKRLALIDQCIEQTILLILLEELDGLPHVENQMRH